MKRFADLILKLDQTNKTSAKLEALENYFAAAPDEDKLWAIALLSGRKPRSVVNSTLLYEWAYEMAGIPLWLFNECRQVVGDFSETVALLLPDSPVQNSMTLSAWMQEIIYIRDKSEEEKKDFIVGAWRSFSYFERFVFNKIIGGSWRIGVSQQMVTRAVAKVLNLDAKQIAHRLMGNWDPLNNSFSELLLQPAMDISTPYPFCLAHPIEGDVADLGNADAWTAEWKWDGIRGQIIKRGGELFIWSRGEDLITDKFPEFQKLKELLRDGTVLDGEILPFKEEEVLSFNVLQTRIGRKNITGSILKSAPVIFFAYDLLELNGEDQRTIAYLQRRANLKELLKQESLRSMIRLSPQVEFNDWKELGNERSRSRDLRSEGLMLKKNDSVYETGRKKGAWWKWKIDPLTIDAVLVYASRGSGRRANLYTDYTFAVWNEERVLVPFAKAYSGLTDQELKDADAFIKKNTLEKFGPVRSVKPELVFEIAFEGISRSTRHKSGIAIRFPRIHRWRRDKMPEQADTLENLRKILQQYGNE